MVWTFGQVFPFLFWDCWWILDVDGTCSCCPNTSWWNMTGSSFYRSHFYFSCPEAHKPWSLSTMRFCWRELCARSLGTFRSGGHVGSSSPRHPFVATRGKAWLQDRVRDGEVRTGCNIKTKTHVWSFHSCNEPTLYIKVFYSQSLVDMHIALPTYRWITSDLFENALFQQLQTFKPWDSQVILSPPRRSTWQSVLLWWEQNTSPERRHLSPWRPWSRGGRRLPALPLH